ncbi:flagellar biosynthesis anti-sigma factor FlgM [Marinimicrobium sp. ABcell2]|uniref:flagellar biosynthesis anti-sigma factor FlgM n=1 Tax=Marinimicrobium sp. ABcell2 TaxID=3069751 RepID=UPI0027B71352|nr:flagellar biosynthesis anti-sigma factor FlgM [Marinimicrobium sp. ABcell2]MDQ2075460.1 flagellar biosynthesis anti-sigma factor FlgM [Marinimicrobium sp. ABcell2]
MAIDTNNSIKTGHTTNNTTGRANSAAPRPGADTKTSPEPTSSRDDVVLSQEAQSLGRLEEKINNLPEVNSERVAEIRQAIAEGRFEVNAQRIAENMLNQDDLLG